jgi:hypothetical protein
MKETAMKKILALVFLVLFAVASVTPVTAQQKTLASTLSVYVFPKTGQDAQQQSVDEAACYDWATGNTGIDPFDLAAQSKANKQQAEQDKAAAQKAGKGAGAKGAVGGAAAGALIGEIASDDAGKGAAIGAAAGLLAGRRHKKKAQKQATGQVEQEYQHKKEMSAQQLDGFRKAFSVCLEAKDYMVKY